MRFVFHRLGLSYLMPLLNRTGLRILMYHRFPIHLVESLNWQCAYLRRHYHLLSLDEVARRLQAADPFPPNSLTITVDDGYADTLQVAHPVFASHSIPVTVFLTTGFIDRRLWLWVDQVRYAFERTRLPKAEVYLSSTGTLALPLETPAQRFRAFEAVANGAMDVPDQERLAMLANLPRSLEVTLPAEAPQEDQALTWDQVRWLARRGVGFGAHTQTHPVLARIPDPATVDEEITGSKRRIEEELQAPVRHFCYPNGRQVDFHAHAVECVKRAGFQTAVTAIPGLNFPSTNPFALKRIAADPGFSRPYFRRLAACYRLGA